MNNKLIKAGTLGLFISLTTAFVLYRSSENTVPPDFNTTMQDSSKKAKKSNDTTAYVELDSATRDSIRHEIEIMGSSKSMRVFKPGDIKSDTSKLHKK